AINFPPEFGSARKGQEAPRGPFNGYGKAHKRTKLLQPHRARPSKTVKYVVNGTFHLLTVDGGQK
ncbi:uncharacterized protein BKA55DRAFT_451966, partial [Fusarium redolens]